MHLFNQRIISMTSPLYSLTVDTTKRTLTLYNNGAIQKTYSVAVGKPSTPTPKGVFTIKNKTPNPGGPYGSRWMGLTAPSIGIHGTNDPASIGNAESHGCIRMYNNDVIELYNIVPLGTVVHIM